MMTGMSFGSVASLSTIPATRAACHPHRQPDSDCQVYPAMMSPRYWQAISRVSIAVVLGVVLLFVSPCSAQYGFGTLPPSFYSDPRFTSNATKPDPWDSLANATWADEDLSAFIHALLYPTTVYVRDDLWSSGLSKGYTYERYELSGFGPFWQMVCGQPALYIDLRQNAFTPTHEQLTAMGVVFESNGTVSFSLRYLSEIDEPESIHAHGILGGWWTDGVPYLNTPPLLRDQSLTLEYNIDPISNSGTHFLHSHYGFNSIHGVSTPLVIQANVSDSYRLANILNDIHTQELLFYAEDWCLVYTNADDVGQTVDFRNTRDPSICQNPFLTLRALYGEWNSRKGRTFLEQPSEEGRDLEKCMKPAIAPEFGSAFFLVNDRAYNDAHMEKVTVDTYARLRVINAARMTHFLLKVPEELNGTIVAVDGSYIEPVALNGSLHNEVWVGIAQRVDILLKIPPRADKWVIFALQEMPDPATSDSPDFLPFESSLAAGLVLYSTDDPPVDNLIPSKVNGTGMLSKHPQWVSQQEMLFKPWPPSAALDVSHAKQYQVNLTGYNGIFGLNFKRGLEFPPMMSESAFVDLIQATEPLMVVEHGEIVCVNITNFSWDTHPIHLHGHKFQVVSYDGESFNGALRDTVLVPAGNCHWVNICFKAAQQEGQFGLHCHMAIHEMAGMFGVVRYGQGTRLVGLTANHHNDDTASASIGIGVALGVVLVFSLLLNGYFIYKRVSEGQVRYHRVDPRVSANATTLSYGDGDGHGNGNGEEEMEMQESDL